MVNNCFQKEQKLVTLLVSLVMITAGIIVFILANTIFKKEQRELTDHLKVNLLFPHIYPNKINQYCRVK